MKFKNITREEYLEHFDFDFEAGKIFWKKPTKSSIRAGTEAGRTIVTFKRNAIITRRLLYWMYHEKNIDGLLITHLNQDPTDNRIQNLTIASKAQVLGNRRGASKNSATGIRGVCLRSGAFPYYTARLFKDGKYVFEEVFPKTPEGLEQARIAVAEARAKHLGKFSGGQ